MNNHTLQQVIDLAVKTAVLQAKKEAILECRPIGSYFITETDDDPNVIFGGGGRSCRACTFCKALMTSILPVRRLKQDCQKFRADSKVSIGVKMMTRYIQMMSMVDLHKQKRFTTVNV